MNMMMMMMMMILIVSNRILIFKSYMHITEELKLC